MKDGRKSPAFMVGVLQDPRESRRALRGLRAMARLGRLAERALAEMEKSGHFPGRAAWLRRSEYGDGFILRKTSFPASLSYERSDVPGYGPIPFHKDKVWERKTATWKHDCVDIRVDGAVFRDGSLLPGSAVVGHVRITVNGATFYAAKEADIKHSITLLRGFDAHASYEMAKAVSAVLSGPDSSKDHRAAAYRKQLASWLHEDGHSLSLLVALRGLVDSYKTVRRVITD